MFTPTLILPHRAAQALSAASKGEDRRQSKLPHYQIQEMDNNVRVYSRKDVIQYDSVS